MSRRRNLLGAALLAAGVAGGIAARQGLAGRSAHADEPEETRPWPSDTTSRRLSMSDGAELHFFERGAGAPVVLLHGITLSADVWHQQLVRLPTEGVRAIAVDLRGHGCSTVGTAGLALDRVTADIQELAEQLELRDAVLVGHSMGGMVALRLLTTDPGLARGEGWLAGLALVATSARPALGRGLPGARVAVTAAGPLLGVAARLAGLLPGPTLVDSEASDPIAALTFAADPAPAQVRLTRRVTARVPARTSIGLLAQLVGLDEARGLRAIRVPTTVVVGRGDLITPPRHARALADEIAGAELVELDDCGHMVMLERPAELDAAIVALCRRVAG